MRHGGEETGTLLRDLVRTRRFASGEIKDGESADRNPHTVIKQCPEQQQWRLDLSHFRGISALGGAAPSARGRVTRPSLRARRACLAPASHVSVN